MTFWDWVMANPGWAIVFLIIMFAGIEVIILALKGKS